MNKISKFFRLIIFPLFLLCGHSFSNAKEWKQHLKIENSGFPKTVFVDKAVTDFPVVKIGNLHVFQLISHGRSGELLLEGKWRTAPEIEEYLREGGLIDPSVKHINIYGCEFAKGTKGKTAVKYLEAHLGVSIAASTNVTGKHGDWILETGKGINVLHLQHYNADLQYAAGNDFDGDGVINSVDIDDDNDGVLDAVESPGCFYTATEAGKIISVTSAVPILAANPLTNTFDGDIATYARNTGSSTSIAGGVVMYDMTPTLPVAISAVNFQMTTWSMVNAGGTFKLQGYNGSVWTDLSASTTNTTVANFSVLNTLQPNVVYQRYRIVGIAGTANYSGVTEITLSVTNYIPSAHQKATCVASALTDFDNDGITNNFDLDSDNDGCGDAFESGATSLVSNSASTFKFTGIVGVNGLDNNLETVLDNAVINYTSTYNTYAIYSYLALCNDKDEDGVRDITDLDDDNDGVLDAVEAGNCYYAQWEAMSIVSISSDMSFSANVAAKAIDNDYSTVATFSSVIPIAGKVLYQIQFSAPLQLSQLKDSLNSTTGIVASGATYRIEATNNPSGSWTLGEDVSAPTFYLAIAL